MNKLAFLLFTFLITSSLSEAWAATNVPLTINLSEAVTVTGTPRVAVDVGGQTRYATYTSGSGTNALTFTLSPQAGDVDLDGITVSSPIDLNGGSMKDAAGNNAVLTFTPPNTSGIKVNYPSLGMDFVYDADGRYSLNGTVYNDLTSFLAASGGTFTRASVGTYYDSTGTLQTAASGTPRFDCDPVTHAAKGILIEESRTNFLTYSQTFSNAIWASNNITKSSSSDTAPDGSTSSYEIIITSDGSSRSIAHSLSATTNYTFSFFIKAGTDTEAAFGLYDTTSSSWGSAGVGTAGILHGSGTVSLISGALFRITGLSATSWTRVYVNRTSTSNVAFIYPHSTSGQTAGQSIKIWGGQVEIGTFPTSYIQTTAAATTRAIDNLTMPTATWHNASAGTAFVNAYKAVPQPVSARYFSLAGGNSQASIINSMTGTNLLYAYATDSSGTSIVNTPSLSTISYDSIFSAAYAFADNDFSFSVNGSSVSTDTTGSFLSFSSLTIGNSSSLGARALNGWIKKFKYYPARVPDAQLPLLSQ